MKKIRAKDLANQFLELYADEIQDGEDITKDAIYDWWVTSGYGSSHNTELREAVEKEIFKALK